MIQVLGLHKKDKIGSGADAWTKAVGKRTSKSLMIPFLLAFVLLFGSSICVYAATVNIAPVSYQSVGTSYITVTSFIPDKSGGRLYVRTRPTTQTDTWLRIRNGGNTLAKGMFPYQTQAPYISTTMSKGKQYNVQVKAVSGKASGQVSGYCTYGN